MPRARLPRKCLTGSGVAKPVRRSTPSSTAARVSHAPGAVRTATVALPRGRSTGGASMATGRVRAAGSTCIQVTPIARSEVTPPFAGR